MYLIYLTFLKQETTPVSNATILYQVLTLQVNLVAYSIFKTYIFDNC